MGTAHLGAKVRSFGVVYVLACREVDVRVRRNVLGNVTTVVRLLRRPKEHVLRFCTAKILEGLASFARCPCILKKEPLGVYQRHLQERPSNDEGCRPRLTEWDHVGVGSTTQLLGTHKAKTLLIKQMSER